MVTIGKPPPFWLGTCHSPPLPTIGLRHDTQDQHSTVDTAVDEYSTAGHSGTAGAQHEQCGTAGAGSHSTSTAQPHGAHSQGWHTPSHDPHTVGLGFGNEKISDPAGMCFLGVVLQKW